MATIEIRGIPHTYHLTEPTSNPGVLVFIHGWLLSHRYWQPLIEQLSPQFRCLSYDLRGFGGSVLSPELPPPGFAPSQSPLVTEDLEPYTPRAYAQDLVTLLDRLEIPTAWLVGHAFGGEVALWCATLQPDRIGGVTCLGAGGGIYLKEEFEHCRTLGQQLLSCRWPWLRQMAGCSLGAGDHPPGTRPPTSASPLPLVELLLSRVFSQVNVYRPLPLMWGRQRLWDFFAADQRAAIGTLFAVTAETEVHRLPQLVAQLSQPVYFLGGQQDPIMTPQYVRHLASFHSLFQNCGSNLVELPQCGHLAMLEQTSLVAAQVQQMLAPPLAL